LPTACTNQPIRGNFTQECLTNPESCSFQPGQTDITSSLLFNTDANSFPEVKKISLLMTAGFDQALALFQIREVCNSRTHNADAPTRQNLLCSYQSVQDVILRSNPTPVTCSPLTQIPVVRGKGTQEGELVMVIDSALSTVRFQTTSSSGQVQKIFSGLISSG
jgi:hypothetical protein